MMNWLVIASVVTVLCFAAYFLGRRSGVLQANRSSVQPGAWVEFTKVVTSKSSSGNVTVNVTVEEGTQGIVSGMDKWNRFSVWIAEPWVHLYDGRCQLYQISDLTAVRTIPFLAVSDELRAPTFESFKKYEKETAEMVEQILSPGLLELQRKMNR